MPEGFQDQVHVEKIRERLWSGRNTGQAAVMIGSGFSLNARRLTEAAPPFGLWRQLAEAMYDELYPLTDPNDRWAVERKLRATSGTGALRLGGEYEAAFSRATLDELILRSVPDTFYAPGLLHRLLLRLPWSDVFTTNYDTLLERSRLNIYERRYDLVQTVSDISGRNKPRIVKLHGSVPSHRPFIVTEEDYRTYPIKFSPFVNMVQQSIMENVFCLIGFSGDDPNFLSWTGWVRDNLRSAAPYIYLCGLLDLSPSERLVLKERRVIPIDLSSLIAERDCPDRATRHALSVEWLLRSLERGAPPDTNRWPEDNDRGFEEPSPGVPTLLAVRQKRTRERKLMPIFDDPKNPVIESKHLVELRKDWEEERESYPGWIIMPHESRNDIWEHTISYWYWAIYRNPQLLQSPEDLLLWYEVNWRLEKAMMPLFLDQVEKIALVVESYSPFAATAAEAPDKITPHRPEYSGLPWAKLRLCWTELVFALAREAREDQDLVRCEKWLALALPATKQRLEWQARWHYERCLYHLGRIDAKQLAACLDLWPYTPELPFWEARRAALLAEIGNFAEAERIAENALETARLRLQPFITDYSTLSQEGWIMFLVDSIKQGRNFAVGRDGGHRGHFRERWAKLQAYAISPWREFELLELALSGPPPEETLGIKIHNSFDPGRSITTRNYASQPGHFKKRAAFSFLRLYEEAAVPFKCASLNIFAEKASIASRWIAPYAPFWSLSTWIRCGDTKGLESHFSRTFVAALSREHVDQFYLMLKPPFEEAISKTYLDLRLANAYLDYRLLAPHAELLSRLCFRLSDEQLTSLLHVAILMYRQPLFRHDPSLHKGVSALFERILYTLPESILLNHLDELLSLPIFTIEEFGPAQPLAPGWCEPMHYIDHWRDGSQPSQVDSSAWSGSIDNLIQIVRSGSSQTKPRALSRLLIVNRLKAFSPEQHGALAEALWSKQDSATGLPAETQLAKFSFLNLPEPQPDLARQRLIDYLLKFDVPRITESRNATGGWGYPVGQRTERYLDDLYDATLPLLPREETKAKFLDWTPDQAVIILDKIAVWWHEEKTLLEDSSLDPQVRMTIKHIFQELIPIIDRVIIPRLAGQNQDGAKEKVLGILEEAHASGICTYRAASSKLMIMPETYDDVVQQLERGILSADEQQARYAVFAVQAWVCRFVTGDLDVAPANILIDRMIGKIISRAQPALVSVLSVVRFIVEHASKILTQEHLSSLLLAVKSLDADTSIVTLKSEDAPSSEINLIELEARPNCREQAADLAHALYELFQNKGDAIPEVLTRWREICATDSLPEVRNAWK